ncbi:MAG TPA: TonB-dependent receptor [Aeromonadales bacterium]|nr:TonB-dependent receptor [Aeromonadales bacterium]
MKYKSPSRSPIFRRTGVATAISAALLLSTGGFAADSKDDKVSSDDSKENVVIVTANRREQNVQDVPFNISAISGEMLSDAQITDAAELMRNIPGVAVVDRGQRNSGVINGIMIRGLNVDGSALGDYALSTVPTVSTYINDTPVYANIVLKDIDRVEVLRGPQATLYGSGSLGGTVKYILNKPELGEFSGKVIAGLSSTDGASDLSWNTDVILNIPLGESMAMRLVAGKMDYAGITDYVNVYRLDANRVPVAPDGPLAATSVVDNVQNADTVDIEYVRVSVLFQPSETFSALFTYQTQSDDVGGRRQQTTGKDGFGRQYQRYENGSIQLEPSSRNIDLGSLEMDLDLGFATLTSSTSSYNHKGDSISENTGFYAQNGWLGAFYYNYPRPMAEAARTYSDKAVIEELRLVSNGDNTIDYVAGIFYQDQDLGATQNSYLRGFQNWADAAFGPGVVVNDNDFQFNRQQNYKEFSFFGELTYNFSEEFRMTVGARRYDNDFKNDTMLGVGLYSSFSFTDNVNFKENDKGTLYKINASYDLDENAMIYSTISEGYRRGGTNAVPLSGIFAESPLWQKFEPDTVTNYEIGIKGSTDSNMNYNVSFFYVDWNNIQINTATTNWGFFAAQNADKAVTKGIEIELEGYFGENDEWHYGIGWSNVSAKLKGDVFTPVDVNRTNPVALDGTKLPGTPDNTINLSLSHNLLLENGWNWANRVSLYNQSSTENAISDSIRFKQTLAGFSIWDFSSSIYADNWSATFYVKNLGNEEGVTGLFKEEYMGTSPAQNYFGNGSKEFIALPRTLGLTVTYQF